MPNKQFFRERKLKENTLLPPVVPSMLEGENEVMLFQCDWFDVPVPASKSKSRGYNMEEE